MKPLKVGDRVVFYNANGRGVGRFVHSEGPFVQLNVDGQQMFFHEKCIRILKPKKKQRQLWAVCLKDGKLIDVFGSAAGAYGACTDDGTIIRFVEAKEKKK